MPDPLLTVSPPKPDTNSNRNVVMLAKGGGIVFAGQLIAGANQFIFGIIVARSLGAEHYGMFNLAMTFVGLVASFALFGLRSGLIRYISIGDSQKDQNSVWNSIQVGLFGPGSVSIIFAIFVFVFANPIATLFFKNPDLAVILRLASLHIPLDVLLNITIAISQGFKRVEFQVYARNILARTLKTILAPLFLLAGFGVMGIISTQIIVSTIALFVLFFLIHKIFPLNRPLRLDRQKASELVRFSLPLFISNQLQSLGGSFETLVLGFLGLTTGVGIFVAAKILSSPSNLFYNSLDAIATPMFAELHHSKSFAQLKVVYQTVTRWAISFNLPFFITIVFFGKPLLSIFGKDFQSGALSLIILGMGALGNAATGQCGPMINMIGKSKLAAFNSFLYLAVTIVVDLLLIPTWGLEGAAVAASVTLVFMNVLRAVQVHHFLNMWPFDRSVVKPVGAGLLAAGAGYVASLQLVGTPQLLQAILGVSTTYSVYILAIILLRFSPEDRLILDKLSKRLHINKLNLRKNGKK